MRSKSVVVCALSLVVILAASAYAQSGKGSIPLSVRGRLDQTDPDAKVTATHEVDKTLTVSAKLDQYSSCVLDDLKAGLWTVTVTSPKFNTTNQVRVPVIPALGMGTIFIDPTTRSDVREPLVADDDKGIEELTPERIAQAGAAADKGKDPPNDSLLMIIDQRLSTNSMIAVLGVLEKAPFSLVIESPFSRAVAALREAKRKFQDSPKLDVNDLNKGAVAVVVGPGSNFTTADGIENVVIERNGQVVKPLSADVRPTTIQNRLGASRASTEGRFTFPLNVFSPDVPITIILIGKSGNFEWSITRTDLSRLK